MDGWFERNFWLVDTPTVDSYMQMTMQELCAALNQEDANEIKTILEVILNKLLPEIESKNEKKNVWQYPCKWPVVNLHLSPSNGSSGVLPQSELEPNLWRRNKSYRNPRVFYIHVCDFWIQKQGDEESRSNKGSIFAFVHIHHSNQIIWVCSAPFLLPGEWVFFGRHFLCDQLLKFPTLSLREDASSLWCHSRHHLLHASRWLACGKNGCWDAYAPLSVEPQLCENHHRLHVFIDCFHTPHTLAI